MTPKKIITAAINENCDQLHPRQADAILAALDVAGYAVVPKEPTPEMVQGYKQAMKALIESIPDEAERIARWGKRNKFWGYQISTPEKVAARFKGMIEAAPRE